MVKRFEIEWQPPTLTYKRGPAGAGFIYGGVGSLTPETYNPHLAIEEVERAEANARMVEGQQEIEGLNQLYSLE
jgi:hypothetical protein